MKPFRFPLQAVLTVRLNQESKALEAFARAQGELEKVAVRHRRILAEIEETFGLRRNIWKKTTSSEDLQQVQQGLRVLQETERHCQVELAKVQANLADKSKALLEARQKREVVEKIHQKRRASYQTLVLRTEQKVADEFATLKSIGGLALKWR